MKSRQAYFYAAFGYKSRLARSRRDPPGSGTKPGNFAGFFRCFLFVGEGNAKKYAKMIIF